MTSIFEPMTGRDLGHVTTWDFPIFLLKRGYLIVKFMVCFDLRTSRSYITAHIPAKSAQWNPGIHLGRGPADVTRPASFYTVQSALLSFGRNNAQLCKRWFEVKAVSKLRYAELLQAVSCGHNNLNNLKNLQIF